MKHVITIALLILASSQSLAQKAHPIPLVRAHAHNDYLHDRPLLDALDNGFCSVEADIWLIEGKLLVAHDRHKVDSTRTLEGLYLEPLRKLARANGGRIHAGGPEFTLLIDIKSNGEETFPVLRKTLERYAEILTTFTGDKVEKLSAVRVIISGSRPRALMESQTLHYAAYDGRLDDIGGGASAAFMPLISSSWPSAFEWLGHGPMPDDERKKLKRYVSDAHAEGRRVRFWAISHREALWKELLEAGVDLINVDDLPKLRDYLLENGWTNTP